MIMITKKASTHPKSTKGIHKSKTQTRSDFEQTLLDNFINLQKVLTNLSIKFDSLSDQISKLLELFEISAKSFAEKSETDLDMSKTDEKSIEKLDSLLDQNKTIARGIMLMEERIRNKNQTSSLQESRLKRGFNTKPLPKF